jgi:hypothetical protein
MVSMESDNRKLSEYLRETATALEVCASGSDEAALGEQEAPHLELVDFDRLRENLKTAAQELEQARIRERESDVVRQWFIDRIKALRRGRRAVLYERGGEAEAIASDRATLPQLMRGFEEEAARLRQTASNFNSGKIGSTSKGADDYRPFKS